MLLADFERYHYLVNVNDSLVKKFKKAQASADSSYAAFQRIIDSPVPVTPSEMVAAQQAMLLEMASKVAVGNSWGLRESAHSIGTNPEEKGVIFSIEELKLSARLAKNPSFKRYPDFIQKTIIKGSRVGMTALLAEIEDDAGLAQLTVIPERSFGLIMPEARDTVLGKAYLFATRIPGVGVGYTFNLSKLSPEVHLLVPQMRTHRGLFRDPS